MVLLRWADQGDDRRASELVKVAEFRSYVRPTWRNNLTSFCTALTGITQVNHCAFPPLDSNLLTQCVAHNLCNRSMWILPQPGQKSCNPLKSSWLNKVLSTLKRVARLRNSCSAAMAHSTSETLSSSNATSLKLVFAASLFSFAAHDPCLGSHTPFFP